MVVKILLSVFVILGLIEITWTLPAPKIYQKKCHERNGLFEVPGSFCRKYYKCNNWIPAEETCPPDQHFNPYWQRCDWEELYPCLEKPTHKECPRPDGNFLKPGTECRIYYSCCNGQPTEKRCPGKTLFDPNKKKCEWPELYTCVESTSPTPTDLVTTSTTFSTSEATPTFDVTDSTSTSTIASSTIMSTPEGKTTVEEISPSSTSILITLSTPEDILTFDDTDSTTTSTPTFPTFLSTPEETSTVEEISSTSIPTSMSTLEDTPTFDDTQTTEETLIVTSPVYPTSSGTVISPSSEEILTTTESNVDSPSPETSISDFTITDIDETTTETDSLTSTSTDIDITESTSATDGEDKRTIMSSQSTKEISLSPLTDSTTINDKTSTQSTSSPGIEDFVCPERSGYFPHPTDRHKFIGCVDWIPQVMDCPSNLVYDNKKRACVYDRKKADHLSKN